MSSGRQHFVENLSVGILSTSLVASTGNWQLTGSFACGSLVGLFITPDLDLGKITYTEKLLHRIPVIGTLILLSGTGYGLMFRHRGISHHFLFGTLTRILYVGVVLGFWFAWFVGVKELLGVGEKVPTLLGAETLGTIQREVVLGLLSGWYLQDWTHLVSDKLSSYRNRQRK